MYVAHTQGNKPQYAPVDNPDSDKPEGDDCSLNTIYRSWPKSFSPNGCCCCGGVGVNGVSTPF